MHWIAVWKILPSLSKNNEYTPAEDVGGGVFVDLHKPQRATDGRPYEKQVVSL